MTEFRIRKLVTQIETELSREGIEANRSLRKVVVGAVISNPFAGRYVEDLSEAADFSVSLGTTLGSMAVEALREPAVSYGKGGLAGLNGSQEHAVMFVTTPFGNALRDVVGGGAAWISSTTAVSSAGAPLTIPLAHKDALFVRENYDAVTFHPPSDAPGPDEVVVVVAVANRGRLNSRLGGLSPDEVLGKDGLR